MRMDRKVSLLLSSLLLVVALPLNATQVGGPRPPLEPPVVLDEGVWEATVTWMQWNRSTGGYVQMFSHISAPTREGCEAQLSNLDPSNTIVQFCTFRAY
ncbi:hypothetical protein SAMN04487938_3023 [Lysobacter sp. cf310]|nr:hypothetical protein SAMN04487938_3023 [Lysobacter sp. cf310]